MLRERETPVALLRCPEANELDARPPGRLCPLPDDGRIAAERALRGIALGRRNCTFAASHRGADHAAIMLTMITTCRLHDVDPKAWLADILARIADLPVSRLHELLRWEWKLLRQADNPADQQAP